MAEVATCSAAPVKLRRSRGSAGRFSSKRHASIGSACQMSRLPDLIIETLLLDKLPAKDLCALACANKRLGLLTKCTTRWRQLFQDKWGDATPTTQRASELAGGWQTLFKDKTQQDKDSAPWRKPSSWELAAALEQLTVPQLAQPELAVLFLLDGSGSVQEDDFSTMTGFIANAASSIQATSPQAQVGILQFSNDVRVELGLQALDLDTLNAVVNDMVRMNGGTNIATCIEKAGELLRQAPTNSKRVLVLITDGRVDGYQAREAVAMAERLRSEQGHVHLFAFGVGRDVARKELLSIVSVTGKDNAHCRYVDLCVREELGW